VKRDEDTKVPLVTVVCVTLNAADEFVGTISSVLAQDYERLEVIVVDGGSSDGTLQRIVEYEHFIDFWISEPDEGPYDAMGKGAALAHGRYVLFMNAGDWFVGEAAISQALRFAPDDSEIIYGHHIYRTIDGVEELHKAKDFESTWRRLGAGELDGSWLGGVPGHQATFTRTVLLQESGGYDTSLNIVADHDFLYRQRARGARFHHCDLVVATYVGGGYSSQNLARCFDEWLEVACRYGPRAAARAFFEPMINGQSAPAAELGPTALRSVGRRLRVARRRSTHVSRVLRGVLRHKATERRIRRSGLFFSRWYLESYPDVAATGVDPIRHYVRHGATEGRDPSPFFETEFYLSSNPEVRSEGLNPLDHYWRFGAAEGRAPNHWLDEQAHLPPGWRTGRGLAKDIAEWLGQATADEILAVWSKRG
jgi:glycosyltransferase involved in cell wall biosynthesis